MSRVTAATLLVALSMTYVPLSSDPASAETKQAPYSTAATPLGILLDDPAARAVLVKYIPSLVQNSYTERLRPVTLKSIQGYAAALLTDPLLAKIDGELAQLIPRPTTALPVTTINTDEAKVRPYTLPDSLVLANGQPVTSASLWWDKRRPEILKMFETLEYGRAPERPPQERFEVFDKGSPAFGGKAIRRQVLVHLADDPRAPVMQLVEYLPASAKLPVPMVLMIGFTAPSAMIDDPGIRPSLVWDTSTKRKVPATGSPMGRLDVMKFLDAGLGVTAYYYGDVEPDFPGSYGLGVRGFYAKGKTESAQSPDSWGAIAAWSWSLSRAQDYLETDPAVDATRVALVGASRLGKTVLWAAANDQRFAAVISCCSGKLGAGLMRRNFGSPISGLFPGEADYWTAGNFRRFYGKENDLPMDSHMLLGLVAPRPVLLQTGRLDHAADPKGEFLAAVGAEPVYRLLGKQGLGTDKWPPTGPIINDIGYHMNGGGHGIAAGDWDIYVSFLVKHLVDSRQGVQLRH